jgi:tetratricopeptide (TPR) repeat protein
MTGKIKYTRKDLKEPDEFITALGRAAAWVRENRTGVAAAAAAVVLLAGGTLGLRSHTRWQEEKAARDLWPHLNQARELLETPREADPQEVARLEELLRAHAGTHSGTRGAVFARYYLGSIAYLRGDYEESAVRFRSALASRRGGDDIMEFLAREGYAQALEANGDAAMAAQAYRDAAAHATGELRTQAWMGEARALTALGKDDEAAPLLRKILEETPDSPMRPYIELMLSRAG